MKSCSLKRLFALLLAASIVVSVAGCKKTEPPVEESSVDEVVSSEPEPDPEPKIDNVTLYGTDGKTLADLYAENEDTIGWLTIPGIKTDNVVMMGIDGKTYPNDDGSTTQGGKCHYLHYDFNHVQRTAGELFADYRGYIKPKSQMSQNIVIYGHHMKNGTMLAGIDNYRSKSYFENHQYFTFNTLWDKHHWRVFTVFMVNLKTKYGNEFDYLQPEYKGEAFTEFVRQYKERQYYDTGVELTENDNFICLSTCTYPSGSPKTDNARLVVCARMCTAEEEAAIAAEEAAALAASQAAVAAEESAALAASQAAVAAEEASAVSQ